MPITELSWQALAGTYDLPDVAVSKDDGVSVVFVGHQVTYTIIVGNVGAATATDVQVVDPVPVGLINCTWACDVSTPCSPASGIDQVFTEIATLDPGSTGTITFICEVDAGAGSLVTNIVGIAAAGDPNPDNDTSEDVDSVGMFDFGDAPEPPFPTTLAENGARHLIQSGFHLGSWIDAEPDGQPTAEALGDDEAGLQDDDDGVTFQSFFAAGSDLEVDVTASGAGYLNVWIDIDDNGTWEEGTDHLLIDEPVVAGLNSFAILISETAVSTDVVARFRLTLNDNGGTLPAVGLASTGEVEDYLVTGAQIFADGFESGDLGAWLSAF